MKKGWQTKTLGEACEMYQPKTISGKDLVEDGAYLVYGANGVIGRYNQYNHEEPQLLITCRGATCGSVNISAPRSWVTGNAMVVRPKNESLEMGYLEYLFRGGIDISKAITGAAQPQITRTNLEPLEISYPESLAEQQRIVGLLDEAFEGLATAKANAEKNLQNARALFESHLQSVFTQRGPGWVETTLEKVLTVQPQNGWSPPAANHAASGTPVLTLSSVTGFVFRPDKLKYTSAKTDPKARYWIQNGDFLITRSNTPELVGHVAIASGIETPTIYPDLIMRMNPMPDRALTEFLYYQLRTPVLRAEIMGRAQGANPTMKKISNGAVKTLPIAVPSIAIQQAIVETLDALTEETQRLARLYERKHAALEALKKSLLHQAFAGEL
jgi:type I restriction enzyme S subunit